MLEEQLTARNRFYSEISNQGGRALEAFDQAVPDIKLDDKQRKTISKIRTEMGRSEKPTDYYAALLKLYHVKQPVIDLAVQTARVNYDHADRALKNASPELVQAQSNLSGLEALLEEEQERARNNDPDAKPEEAQAKLDAMQSKADHYEMLKNAESNAKAKLVVVEKAVDAGITLSGVFAAGNAYNQLELAAITSNWVLFDEAVLTIKASVINTNEIDDAVRTNREIFQSETAYNSSPLKHAINRRLGDFKESVEGQFAQFRKDRAYQWGAIGAVGAAAVAALLIGGYAFLKGDTHYDLTNKDKSNIASLVTPVPGPRGNTGAPGSAGQTGPAGAPGATGSAGAQGPKGLDSVVDYNSPAFNNAVATAVARNSMGTATPTAQATATAQPQATPTSTSSAPTATPTPAYQVPGSIRNSPLVNISYAVIKDWFTSSSDADIVKATGLNTGEIGAIKGAYVNGNPADGELFQNAQGFSATYQPNAGIFRVYVNVPGKPTQAVEGKAVKDSLYSGLEKYANMGAVQRNNVDAGLKAANP